jgi:alpha-amylase
MNNLPYTNNSTKTFKIFQSVKITICSLLVFANIITAFAQSVTVTFQVDMRGLNISPAGVHIAGDFQQAAGFGGNWNPGATPLTYVEDSIYAIQVEIPSGTYFYKYINGNQWPQAENPPALCSFTANNNRSVQVGASDLVLPPVPFNACNPTVRFSLSLGEQTISPNGLFVYGDFQEVAGFPDNWNPTQNQMFDYSSDGLYETIISIPPGEYRYQYLNGGMPDVPEPFASECMDSIGYRTFTVESNQQLDLWDCYGS